LLLPTKFIYPSIIEEKGKENFMMGEMPFMKVAIVRATIAREKLMADNFTPDSEEIIGYEEVDEEEFYRPLAELLYKRIKEMYEEGQVENNVGRIQAN
jgi:hypothetical protein